MNWAELPCLAQDGECRGEKTNFLLVNRKFSRAVWSDLSSITAHSSWAGNCGGGGGGWESKTARQRESGRKGWATLLPECTSMWIMIYDIKALKSFFKMLPAVDLHLQSCDSTYLTFRIPLCKNCKTSYISSASGSSTEQHGLLVFSKGFSLLYMNKFFPFKVI